MGHGPGDGGSRPVDGQFPDALGVEGAVVGKRKFDEFHVDVRGVGGGRDDVVGVLIVLHDSVLDHHVLVQGESDGLGDAALDLTGGQHRIDHPAALDHRDKIRDFGNIFNHVHFHFRHVAGPGIPRVRVPGIGIFVEIDVGRILRFGILNLTLEFPLLLQVLFGTLPELLRLPVGRQLRVALEFNPKFLAGPFDEAADDHGGSGGHRRSAVGHLVGINPVDVDPFGRDVAGLGSNLGEGCVGPLTVLDVGGHDVHLPLLGQADPDLRTEHLFPAPAEPGSVEEEGKVDALFNVVVFVVEPFEFLPFFVVVRLLKRPVQHHLQVDVLPHHLPRWHPVPPFQEVSPPDFRRIDPQLMGGTSHVEFHRKN